MQLPVIGKVKRPSRWIVGLAVPGALAVGTGTYFMWHRASPKLDVAKLTVPVRAQNLTLRITASGTVQPVQEVNISPKQPGRMTALYVDQGDRVEQGQILARMDDRDIRAQVVQMSGNLQQAQAQLDLAQAGNRKEDIAQAKARLSQAQAQLSLAVAGNRPQDIAQAKAQVEAARAKVILTNERVTRNIRLYQQGAVSKDTLDAAISDDRSARAELQRVQQALSTSQQGSRVEDIARLKATVAESQQAPTRGNCPASCSGHNC
jgi:HlyD family secretion protein